MGGSATYDNEIDNDPQTSTTKSTANTTNVPSTTTSGIIVTFCLLLLLPLNFTFYVDCIKTDSTQILDRHHPIIMLGSTS